MVLNSKDIKNNFDKDKLLSLAEFSNIYNTVEAIIDGLNEPALKQMLSGTNNDIDKLMEVLLNETYQVIYGNEKGVSIYPFNYLEKLTESVDETLKKQSFNYFISSVLSGFEMSWHHIEWANFIQMFRLLGVLAARDHSKSYLFSFAYPLWKMYRYEKSALRQIPKEYLMGRIGMLITNKFKLARHLLKLIREEVQSNDILREKLFIPSKIGWGAEEITCKNGASLLLGAFDSSLRGFHPGYIIVDDFLNKSALYSAEQREKYEEVFYSEIMNMILPGGQVVVAGTPFHAEDLYAKLKKDKMWRVFEYPGVFPDGRVLWPSRYSLEDLLEKKESQGSIKFSREILVKPVTSESTIFPYEIVAKSFVGMDGFIMARNILSYKKKMVRVNIGCDFAISANIGADYTVFTVVGQDELDNYYLIWYWRAKGSNYNEQMMMLKQMNADFKPDTITIETNGYQKVMYQMALDSNLPVVEQFTGTNKYDYDKGLPALATLFEQGRIKFPRGDAFSRDMTDVIVSELTSITWSEKEKIESTSKHDDTVMSLWLAMCGLKYIHSNFSFDFL